ncbi:hypothetical protein PPACK8108_LOCUS284 [Phakopsora pachyrhizi]|uniref:Phosducin thioredoxin-like domain-containing protein n=1 Tax=Phakopsora pachyrhizi TaxID=170000 RepID=A0AAV0AEX9_PHAPC|nr:hypothetical protein PPACK8108_LOCUS284 [Phakopsora pachyrhizi]
MPALRYSEDTEFNDALRARGILPSLESEETTEDQNEVEIQDSGEGRINCSLDLKSIDEIDLEEDLPVGLIDSWKTRRLDELKSIDRLLNSRGSNTGLKPIGKDDFVREVNEASKIDIDHPGCLPGTGVIVCLWNNSTASTHFINLLSTLSTLYPTTRFLSIPGTSCIQNYPDQHQPTIICYRNGKCLAQYVGLGKSDNSTNPACFKGHSTRVDEIEDELVKLKVLEPHLRRPIKSLDKIDDDSEEEGEKLKMKKTIKNYSANDDDFELDL